MRTSYKLCDSAENSIILKIFWSEILLQKS